MKAKNNRPYVICHMIPSVDGRIVTRDWKLPDAAYGHYDRTAATFNAEAWMVGRISMQPYASSLTNAAGRTAVPSGDHIAPGEAKKFAVVLDTSAKLTFKNGKIDGEHVISLVSAAAPGARLSALRHEGSSYLLCRPGQSGLRAALRRLRGRFGIRKLLLEGGGRINGTMLEAGLIDELSLLIAPSTDGRPGRPTLFDSGTGMASVRGLKLISNKALPGGVVWLRYKIS